MKTQDAFDIIEARRAVLDTEDEVFGQSKDEIALAVTRETAAEKARNAVGILGTTKPEATHDEIVAAIEPLVVAAQKELDSIPQKPTATRADKLRLTIVTIREMEALVPLDSSDPPADGDPLPVQASVSANARVNDPVLYTDPAGTGPMAAIVTAVHGDGLVNLAAFHADGVAFSVGSVPYSAKAGSKGRWTRRR